MTDTCWDVFNLVINQDKLEQQGARSSYGNCFNKIKVEFLFISNVYVIGNVTNNLCIPLRYIFKAIVIEVKLLDKTAQTHWDQVVKVNNYIESLFKWSILVNPLMNKSKVFQSRLFWSVALKLDTFNRLLKWKLYR